MNEDQTAAVVKIYITDHPRTLGLFHWGPAKEATPGAVENAGHFGIIGHVGPCRCGDPTHTYPRWYSVTSCVYVRAFGHILTCRIPSVVARALLWLSAP